MDGVRYAINGHTSFGGVVCDLESEIYMVYVWYLKRKCGASTLILCAYGRRELSRTYEASKGCKVMRVRGRASDVGDAEPKRSRNLWDPKKKKLPEENTVELLGICKASSFSLSKHVILRVRVSV
ncbi:hypothetical protein V6N11_063277 [Hibiscus sabdariffa]|uniref:Uncharacterized protein n=2 Tax=Hibiscus sabdariffa TaxID=183260 RepID=A0ABR2AI04_9ROSI